MLSAILPAFSFRINWVQTLAFPGVNVTSFPRNIGFESQRAKQRQSPVASHECFSYHGDGQKSTQRYADNDRAPPYRQITSQQMYSCTELTDAPRVQRLFVTFLFFFGRVHVQTPTNAVAGRALTSHQREG